MKHRKLAITLIIIVSVIALVAGAIALDLFGLKTTLRYYTGYPYPLTPRIKDIEDFEELCGFDFADDAVLEKVTIEKSFGPSSEPLAWPHYVETDLWEYDSVISMSQSSVELLISKLEAKHYNSAATIRYSDFTEAEIGDEKYDYIYYGDSQFHITDKPYDEWEGRSPPLHFATVVCIKLNDDETATVCVSRMIIDIYY